ncbi:MAG TPA: T9SS type A sorting domain-containing protein, partial [Bacteroidia bacterium]|nr:T9SS type A sorting domain-containing protein [Bacteroidia bacterium]
AGGMYGESGSAICVDAAGFIYITGSIGGTSDFGGILLSGAGAFVAKYSPGGSVIWAEKIDSSQGGSYGQIIISSDSAKIYVGGDYYSQTNFGCNILPLVPSPKFLACYDATGACQWVESFSATILSSVTIDKSNNLYFTGGFTDSAVFGNNVLNSSGGYDVYIAKCNSDGSWIWAISAGSTSTDVAEAIDVDKFGHVYITGYFELNIAFGCTSLTSTGVRDIFISCYDTSGTCKWVRQAGGGSGNQYSCGLKSDLHGNCIITGSILDTTYFGSFTLIPSAENMYAVNYDSTGTCMWAVESTGIGADRGSDLGIDSSGNVYVAGSLWMPGVHYFGAFPLSASFYNFNNKYDMFLTKINNLNTGIPNLQSSLFNLQLFPNPTTGTIQLTLPVRQAGISTNHNAPLECEIINMMGEKVFKSQILNPKSQINLDVSFLAKGIYLVRVGDGKSWENKKMMVVQRTPYGE